MIHMRSFTPRIIRMFKTTAKEIREKSPGRSPAEIRLSMASSIINGLSRVTQTQKAMMASTPMICFL